MISGSKFENFYLRRLSDFYLFVDSHKKEKKQRILQAKEL